MFKRLLPLVVLGLLTACAGIQPSNSQMNTRCACCKTCECCKDGMCNMCREGMCPEMKKGHASNKEVRCDMCRMPPKAHVK